MFYGENDYEVRKKYCPSLRKNVIVKVQFGPTRQEECTERAFCEEQGGCTNPYAQRDSSSHSS